jgi:tripartite-type tricarboxylate transporter receptor subunit TctC
VFLAKAGINMVHVPYKTSSDLLSDMMTGRVDAAFTPTAFVLSLLNDGKLQALAVATEKAQTDPYPVPSAQSAGVDYLYSTWYGFLAPAKTPAPVLQTLAAAFAAGAADPELQAKVRTQGITPEVKTLADFDAHIREDMKTLAPVIQDIARDTQ